MHNTCIQFMRIIIKLSYCIAGKCQRSRKLVIFLFRWGGKLALWAGHFLSDSECQHPPAETLTATGTGTAGTGRPAAGLAGLARSAPAVEHGPWPSSAIERALHDRAGCSQALPLRLVRRARSS